jgi:hypothetical protein
MVNIATTPVQTGDNFSTKYEGSVTTTKTDYVFPKVQESVFVHNFGHTPLSINVDGGPTEKIAGNRGYYSKFGKITTVSLQAPSGSNPFMIEGRSKFNTLSFFGKPEIAQPTVTANTTGKAVAAVETELNELKTALRNLGLIV